MESIYYCWDQLSNYFVYKKEPQKVEHGQRPSEGQSEKNGEYTSPHLGIKKIDIKETIIKPEITESSIKFAKSNLRPTKDARRAFEEPTPILSWPMPKIIYNE